MECYRAEARVRKQWEAREDRLAQQLKELQYQKQPKDVSCSVSHYQSNKGVKWVDVQNTSEEDPMMIGEKVCKPVAGSLGVSDAVASGTVFNVPLSRSPGNVTEPLVRTSSTISEIINSDPTASYSW